MHKSAPVNRRSVMARARVEDMEASFGDSNSSHSVVVTHNAKLAEVADRVLRLSDGRIVSDERVSSPKASEEIDW